MTSNYNAKIGEWLQEQRINRKLTQQDVADLLGVTKTAIHYWESGKRTIYADNFIDYCKAINADPTDLMRRIYEE